MTRQIQHMKPPMDEQGRTAPGELLATFSTNTTVERCVGLKQVFLHAKPRNSDTATNYKHMFGSHWGPLHQLSITV